MDGVKPFDMDVEYLQVGGTVSYPDAEHVIPYFGMTVGAARFSPTGRVSTTKRSSRSASPAACRFRSRIASACASMRERSHGARHRRRYLLRLLGGRDLPHQGEVGHVPAVLGEPRPHGRVLTAGHAGGRKRQEILRRRPRPRRPARRVAAARRRRVRRRHGRVGRRQVDAAQSHRRARRAGLGPHRRRRPGPDRARRCRTHETAARPHGLRLPGVPPAAAPDGRRATSVCRWR